MKVLRKNKGITLIALIITIIVLLILAGVSIATLAGDNGVLTQTSKAKKKNEIATIREEVELSMQGYSIKHNTEGANLKEHFVEDLKLDETKITDYESAKAIAFWYKDYLFVVDEKEMKIECMAGEIVEETNNTILYQDVLEDGKFVVEVKKNIGYNDQLKGDYKNKLKTVIIDNGVEQISYAFYECINLENVYLPKTLKVLGTSIFDKCSRLKSIAFPNTLTDIKRNAFGHCESLTNIELPSSILNIEDSAFGRCNNLESAIIHGKITILNKYTFQYDNKLKKVILPDTILTISGGAFQFCNSIEEIYIPKSVKFIEQNALQCASLVKVYYGGTKEEWENIEISNENNNNRYIIEAIKYYYSEQEPQEEGNFWHYNEKGNIVEWGD